MSYYSKKLIALISKKNLFLAITQSTCCITYTGTRIFRFLADFRFLHGQFGHSRNLYRSAIKNVRGVGMFGVSLLGRLCCYTDDPLRSGFHVESVFY